MKIEYSDQLTWIHCGEALLLETVALDKETLKKALEIKKNIIIETKDISQLDTAGIQLLLNFILAVEKEKIPFKWQEPSAILIEKAIILGVEHLMKLRKFIKKVEVPKSLEQTLPTFIEESSENLREMEETLSSINLQHLEPEKINRIFRVVHTLKGNSTLFGVTTLTRLMHTLESFLDEIRTHKNLLKIFHIEFLFKVISAIKNVLSDILKKKSYNERLLWHLNEIFLEFTKRIQLPIVAPKQQENVLGWHIICKSSKDLFKKKLEPSKPFETLKNFGPLETIANNEQLPDFLAFDPELCYLTWKLNSYTIISIKEVSDYLLWVFREEDIVISSIPCHNQKEFLEEIKTIEALATHKAPTITSIRVPIEKIETVMHSVSELVIVESIFKQAIESLGVQSNKLHEIFDRLEQNSKELEDNILHIRMVPLAFLINRFPQEITDLANKLGKEVNFVISGEQNELDKNIIEKITDPLMHLIRNAIDHGIESPQVREMFGKNKKGILKLDCYQEGHSIIIEISDDGAGIDKEKIQKIAIAKKMITVQEKLTEREIYQLLFRPGFSTVEKISDISGRGVGLDIVEKNIYSLGGHIQVNSTLGKGTTFRLKLPLTAAIIESQLMRVEEEVYIIPLTEIVEIMKFDVSNIVLENNVEYYCHNKEKLKLIYLHKILSLNKSLSTDSQNISYIIIVESKGKNFALVCNDLLLQQRIIVKTIEENFCKIPGIDGVATLSDGSVGLILNLIEIIDIAFNIKLTNMVSTESFFKNNAIGTFRNKKNKDDIQNNTLEYIYFSLSDRFHGITMSEIRGIYPWKKPNFVPFSPKFMMGIIDFRGMSVPIIDLSAFFGFTPIKQQSTNVFIIVNIQKNHLQKTIGLAIDNIPETQMGYYHDIKSSKDSEFEDKYLISDQYIQGFIKIEEKLVTMININNIIALKDSLGEKNEISV